MSHCWFGKLNSQEQVFISKRAILSTGTHGANGLVPPNKGVLNARRDNTNIIYQNLGRKLICYWYTAWMSFSLMKQVLELWNIYFFPRKYHQSYRNWSELRNSSKVQILFYSSLSLLSVSSFFYLYVYSVKQVQMSHLMKIQSQYQLHTLHHIITNTFG